MIRPIDSNGNILINRPAVNWPGGYVDPVAAEGPCGCGEAGCRECALIWDGSRGPAYPIGVGGALGYGYGQINPKGPRRGNLPGPLPQTPWWNTLGYGSELVPALTRCLQLIINPVVRTKWRISFYDDRPATYKMPTWIYAPMMAGRVPGPEMPLYPAARRLNSHDFWSSVLACSILYGRAAVVYAEDGEGQPRAGTLRQLNPFMITVDERGRWVFDPDGDDPLTADFDGGFRLGGGQWRLRVFRNFAPHLDPQDDFMGGVLIRHAATWGLAVELQRAAESVFRSAVPAGVLKVSQPNFGADDAAELRRAWTRAHAGKEGIAVLNSSVEFSPISWAPRELEMDAMRRATAQDVALAFALDPGWALGVSDSSNTYANLVDRNLGNVRDVLSGYAASLMEVLTTILPWGQRAEVDWADYTSPSAQEKAVYVQGLLASGVITQPEAREQLGFPPQPDQVPPMSDVVGE